MLIPPPPPPPPPHRQVLFLNEVEEILEMVQAPEFMTIMKPLFARIALCVGSPHFQVAERALFLWNNEYIVSLIAQQRQEVLPLVFEALYTNSRAHWNSTVHGLTCNVVKLFMEMDAKLFDECSADYREKQEKLDEVESAKQNKWISIKEMAEKSPLYAKTKNRLEPTSSLAYAMRLTSIQKGQTMFDDGSSLDNLIVQKFGEISIAPTTDALRRKSTLPTKKKDGE
jgi:serine/threonine-protein phosphatase 2A regulatory subunit B'